MRRDSSSASSRICLRPLVRRLHHLGALHHASDVGLGVRDDLLGLAVCLGPQLLALLQQPTCRPQLIGQVDRISSSMSRTSSRLTIAEFDIGMPGGLDDLDELAEQVLGLMDGRSVVTVGFL
jgi:hypothetical protein